jgi:hypothetical protein
MRLVVAIAGLLACVSCTPSKSEQVDIPKRVNLEVVGSPDCLAKVTASLGLPIATLPVWKKLVGRMELGPIDATELKRVIGRLRETGCARTFRVRACRTTTGDLDLCNVPTSAVNGS